MKGVYRIRKLVPRGYCRIKVTGRCEISISVLIFFGGCGVGDWHCFGGGVQNLTFIKQHSVLTAYFWVESQRTSSFLQIYERKTMFTFISENSSPLGHPP